MQRWMISAGWHHPDKSGLQLYPKKMRNRCFLSSVLMLVYGIALATPAVAAETEPAVSLKPIPIFEIGKFAITNSMLVTWIVAAGIIVFAQIATQNIKPIPSGIQNFWEWLVGGLYNFLEGIIGRELVRKTFWFFATIFILISRFCAAATRT